MSWSLDNSIIQITKKNVTFIDLVRDFGGIFSGVFAILKALAILPARFSYRYSILNALFLVKKYGLT